MTRLFGAVLTLIGFLTALSAQAATFEIRATNPYGDPRFQLLDLNQTYSEAIGFIQGLGPSKPTLEGVQEDWDWVFRGNAIRSDGAHSYETLLIPAAVGSLQAGRVIHLSGQIEKGDAEVLQRLIKAGGFSNCRAPGYCPFANVISLDSPGGSFAEALRLAEIIRSENFVTVVGPNATCESACTLMFLGGYTSYEGRFFPRRFAHVSARIGVHQPAISLPRRDYSAGEVDQILAILSRSTNAVTSFFLGSGVSIGLMDRMFATAPEDMYTLTPLDLAGEHVFLFDWAAAPNQPLPGRLTATRAAALAYCGQSFRSTYKVDSMDLVHNLQVDALSFITFETGRNFACMGHKSNAGTWQVEICDSNRCVFETYGQVEMMPKDPALKYYNQMLDIAVGIDNAELGIAIRDYAHRGALLAYVREFYKDESYLFRDVPLTPDQIGMPLAYCGALDDANPELVRMVQGKLNDLGINVGRPDGAPGPNTREGIQTAQNRLTGDTTAQGRVTPALLQAMGIPSEAQARFRFCDPAYDH
ncbi:peptidoglycan-binding protein [Shimia sp. W99]